MPQILPLQLTLLLITKETVHAEDLCLPIVLNDTSVAIDIAHDSKTVHVTDLCWTNDVHDLPLTFGLAPTQCHKKTVATWQQ